MILLTKDTTPYEVFIDERVEKDLEKIPKYVVEKFLRLLDEFEKNPIRPRSGFDVKSFLLSGIPWPNRILLTASRFPDLIIASKFSSAANL